MKRSYLLFFFFFTYTLFYHSQNKDSLWQVYRDKTQPDSTRLKALHKFAWTYMRNNPDSAILLSEEELQLAIKANLRSSQAMAYNTLGACYSNKGIYPKALDYFLKSLKIKEEIGNKRSAGSTAGNIGVIYLLQKNYPKALEYYFKSLHIAEEFNDKQAIAICYLNIAGIYREQANYNKALEYYSKNLAISREIGDEQGISDCYLGLANIYSYQKDKPKALENYLLALKIKEKIGDKRGITSCYLNLAQIETDKKDYKKAMDYATAGIQISKETQDIENERMLYQTISEICSKTNNYKEAYTNYIKFKTLTDSIFNIENSEALSDLKTNFEVEKKEAELKAKADAQQAIVMEEQKRQRFIIYSVITVLIIVFIFSIALFRRFRITQKQKEIIEIQKEEVLKQKHIVEEHQKEIIDSITYAKRLQLAILPSSTEIKKLLPLHFIFYKPKDIIAGDFYWMEEFDGIIFIAAADSTGHGVPGAMVSVVCSNALNRAVKEFGLRDTGRILDKTRELVLETFEKSGEEIKDGMDISLLRLEYSTRKAQWSGANNALWYISSFSSPEGTVLQSKQEADKTALYELKPDKQPIGKTDDPKPFTTHTLELHPGDLLYLMTDGYPDQFGGPKGKKYKYKQLQENLFANRNEPLEEQKNKLVQNFEQWKGKLLQVDDITIIGIRV